MSLGRCMAIRAVTRRLLVPSRPQPILHRHLQCSATLLQKHDEEPPITAKYEEKLKARAAREGLHSIAALRKKYKRESAERERIRSEAKQGSSEKKPAQPSSASQSAQCSASKPDAQSPVKMLSSYVDVAKLRELPARELEYIWRARCADKPNTLSAVIPADVYGRMEENARRNPMFVLPLPREKDQGVEMHLLQWSFPARDVAHLMITSLLEYKTRGEYAAPHTTIAHHLELREDKQVVLMRGEVEADRGVSVDEAQLLILSMQKFYAAQPIDATGARRIKLLESFSRGSHEYSLDSVMQETDKVT